MSSQSILDCSYFSRGWDVIVWCWDTKAQICVGLTLKSFLWPTVTRIIGRIPSAVSPFGRFLQSFWGNKVFLKMLKLFTLEWSLWVSSTRGQREARRTHTHTDHVKGSEYLTLLCSNAVKQAVFFFPPLNNKHSFCFFQPLFFFFCFV